MPPDDLDAHWANLRDYWLGWGAEFAVRGPLAMFRSGVPFPLFNGVRQVVGDPLDAWALAEAELAGTPWMWWVGDDSPPGLADELRGHGAVEVVALPVMRADLDAWSPAPLPDGLTVGAPEDVDEWVRTWVPASDMPPEFGPPLAAVERARAVTDGYVRLEGRLDGRVVGSAVLLVEHGVGGIYAVSTTPPERHRGIGWAMTDAALAAARERGVRAAYVQATSQGAPLYRRMGFVELALLRGFVPPSTARRLFEDAAGGEPPDEEAR